MTALYFAGSQTPSRFPERWELERLGFVDEGVPLEPFLEAAWQTTRRCWVLDPHFVPYGLHGIELALQGAKATDVRILSTKESQKAKHEKELWEAIESSWNQGRGENQLRRPVVHLEWRDWLPREKKKLREEKPQQQKKLRKYPFAHDRFVVLDENVWHFGFAAGGSCNCLSAASGPWNAERTEAVRFYDTLWRDLYRG